MLWDGFEEYCRQRGTTPAQVPFTDQAVSDFLEWLLSAQAGSWDAGGAMQRRGGEEAGYDSPDYSFNSSDDDVDGEGGDEGGGVEEVVLMDGASEGEEGDQHMAGNGDSGGCWAARGLSGDLQPRFMSCVSTALEWTCFRARVRVPIITIRRRR